MNLQERNKLNSPAIIWRIKFLICIYSIYQKKRRGSINDGGGSSNLLPPGCGGDKHALRFNSSQCLSNIFSRGTIEVENLDDLAKLFLSVSALPNYVWKMSCADLLWMESWVNDLSRPRVVLPVVPDSEERVGLSPDSEHFRETHNISALIREHHEPTIGSFHLHLLRTNVRYFLLFCLYFIVMLCQTKGTP